MRKTPLKISAFITALCFLFTNHVLAFPQAISLIASKSTVETKQEFRLSIPENLGTIQELSTGTGPTIIHIQEAHGNYEIQKKIQRILHYLNKNYGIKTLLLEGDDIELQPELLRFFPNRKGLNQKLMEQLAKEGIVTGPELFLAKETSARAYGIEDRETYVENGRMFVEVLKAQSETKKFLQDINRQIERLTSPLVNQKLRNFLGRRENFEANLIPFEFWVEELKKWTSETLEADLDNPWFQADWPMLTRYFALQRFAKQLSLSGLEKERGEFLNVLRRYRLPDDLYEQIQKHLSSKISQSRLPYPETGLLFEKMISYLPENFNYQAFPNVSFFIGHLILQSELQGSKFMGEIERLTEKITEKLAQSQTENQIIEILKDYRLLQHLFRLELTPNHYDQIIARGESIHPRQLIGRLMELNTANLVKETEFQHLDEIESLFEKAFEFYRGVKTRDQLMLANLENRLAETGADKVVVITGGFHSGPFQKYLTDKNYNYALISPKTTQAQLGREQYVQTVLENYLSSEKITPATYRIPDRVATPIPHLLDRSTGLAFNIGPTTVEILGLANRLAVKSGEDAALPRSPYARQFPYDLQMRTQDGEVAVGYAASSNTSMPIGSYVLKNRAVKNFNNSNFQAALTGPAKLALSEMRSTEPTTPSPANFKPALDAYIRQAWLTDGREDYNIREFIAQFGTESGYGQTEEQIYSALRDIEGKRSITKGKFWFALLPEVNDAGDLTGRLVTFGFAHEQGVQHRGAHVFAFTRNPAGELVALISQVRRGKVETDNRLDATVSGHGKIGQRGLDAAMDEFVDETGVIGFDRNRLVAIRNRAFNTDLWAKVGRKDFTGTAGYDAQGVYSSASKEAHNRELISAFGVWMPWDEFQAMQTSLAASGGTEEVAEFKAMTVDEILRLAANNPRGLASGLLAYLSDSNVRAGFLAEVQEKVVAPNDVDARLVAASNSEQRVVPTADVANYVIPKNARILAMQYTDGVAPYPIEEAYGNGTYRIVSQQLNWNRRPASLQQSDFAEQILAEISPTETPNLYNFINGPTANDPLRMFDQISLDQNNTSQAISFEEVVSIAILLSVMRNFNYTMILNTTAEKNALIADLTRALKFNPTVAIPNLHIEAAEETRGGYYAVLHRSFSKTQDPTGVFGTNRDELSRLPAAQASLVGLIESNRKTSHVRNVSAFATLLRDLVKNMLVIYNQAVLDRADGATGVAAELKMLASRLMARSA